MVGRPAAQVENDAGESPYCTGRVDVEDHSGTIEEDADALETSLHTVYYESLCRAPRQMLRSLFEGVDLDPDRMRQPDVESALSKIRPPHEKWRTVLDDEQLAAIDFLAPLLDRRGYADA